MKSLFTFATLLCLSMEGQDGGNTAVLEAPAGDANPSPEVANEGGTPATGEEKKEEKKEKVEPTVLSVIDGITYIKKEYKEGRNKDDNYLEGFGFAAPRFASVAQVMAHYDTQLKKQNKHSSQHLDKEGKETGDGETGEAIILDLIHTSTDGKLRTRVKASTPSVGDAGFKTKTDVENYFEKQKKENPSMLLFSAEEAHAWIPGIREISGAALTKSLLEQYKELLAAGKTNADPEVLALLGKLADSVK